ALLHALVDGPARQSHTADVGDRDERRAGAGQIEHEPAARDEHLALGPEAESAHDDTLERLLGDRRGHVEHALARELLADLARGHGDHVEMALTTTPVAPAEHAEDEGDDDEREDHERGDQAL